MPFSWTEASFKSEEKHVPLRLGSGGFIGGVGVRDWYSVVCRPPSSGLLIPHLHAKDVDKMSSNDPS